MHPGCGECKGSLGAVMSRNALREDQSYLSSSMLSVLRYLSEFSPLYTLEDEELRDCAKVTTCRLKEKNFLCCSEKFHFG